MKNKIIILALVIICFIAFPIIPVLAADEYFVFDDDVGDVFDEDFNVFPDQKDIDITKIYYNKTGKTLDLEINFFDKIKKSTSIDLVFSCQIITSDEDYSILYYYSHPLPENITVFSNEQDFIEAQITGFNSNKLTITFDLFSEDEIFEDLIIFIAKADKDQTYAYTDLYPNQQFLEVNAIGDTKGKVGESLSFSGSATGGPPPGPRPTGGAWRGRRACR